MDYPSGKNQHVRHLLFYAYQRGQKPLEAVREICDVYGENFISYSTARKWFIRFEKGRFELDDMPRAGRRSLFDNERLKELLKEGHQTSRELAAKMNCDHKTILNHLRLIE